MQQIVKLDDLQTTFFARSSRIPAYESRIEMLKALIANGTQVDPPLVTLDKRVIDGRLRIDAYRQLGYTEIRVKITTETREPELLAMALTANCGGSLPANPDDIGTVVGQLLALHTSETKIIKILHPLPSKLIKERIRWAVANARSVKLRKAKGLLATGDYTAVTAAKEVGLDPAEFKSYIAKGHREHIDLTLDKKLRGSNMGHSQKLRKLFDDAKSAYVAGQLDEEQVLVVIQKARGYSANIQRHCDAFEKRFLNEVKVDQKLA